MRARFDNLIRLWARYERHIAAGALLFGFVFDSLTLNRPDSLIDNVILLAYLVISGGAILLLGARLRQARQRESVYEPLFLSVVLQFAFGNLASGLLVLYARSGTLAGSFLFFLIFASLLLGNEFLKSRYAQLRFNVGIYFILLFAYLSLTMPILLGRVDALAFLVSGAASIAAIAAFLGILYVIDRAELKDRIREIIFVLAGIFSVFNALYFLNVIPPVPLALRDIGLYHTVTKTQSAGAAHYEGLYEPGPWYQFWNRTNGVYHAAPSEPAYCFSSVFAPAGIAVRVVHVWERYDEQTKRWTEASRFAFSISGGRDEGYRGWSMAAVTEGKWRCNVETPAGALIGRMTFTVKSVPVRPELRAGAL